MAHDFDDLIADLDAAKAGLARSVKRCRNFLGEQKPPVTAVATAPKVETPVLKSPARPVRVPSERNLLPIAVAVGLILIAVLAYFLSAGVLG